MMKTMRMINGADRIARRGLRFDKDNSGGTLVTVAYGYDVFDNLVARHHNAVGPGNADATYNVWEGDQVALIGFDADGAGTGSAAYIADRLLWDPGTDAALAGEQVCWGDGQASSY